MTKTFFVWHESIWTRYNIWSLCISLTKWWKSHTNLSKNVIKFSKNQTMKCSHFWSRLLNIIRIWMNQMKMFNNARIIRLIVSMFDTDDRFSSFFWKRSFSTHTNCETCFILTRKWLIWNFNFKSSRILLHRLIKLEKELSSCRWARKIRKNHHLLVNENTWASCFIAFFAKYNYLSFASVRHSNK